MLPLLRLHQLTYTKCLCTVVSPRRVMATLPYCCIRSCIPLLTWRTTLQSKSTGKLSIGTGQEIVVPIFNIRKRWAVSCYWMQERVSQKLRSKMVYSLCNYLLENNMDWGEQSDPRHSFDEGAVIFTLTDSIDFATLPKRAVCLQADKYSPTHWRAFPVHTAFDWSPILTPHWMLDCVPPTGI